MTPTTVHTAATPPSGVPATGPDLPRAPAAQRRQAPGWRDPRLVAGVLVVAGSVLLGSYLFARADDTTLVWAARRALPVGATLSAGDLETRRVGLAGLDRSRYLPVSGTAPAGRVLQREVGTGELLPSAALAAGQVETGVRIPLAVGAADLPDPVRVGTVVDVWLTEAKGSGSWAGRPAERAFGPVRVVALPRSEDSLAPQSERAVVVLVPGVVPEEEVGRFLARAAAGRVVLTQSQGEALR